MKNKFDLWFGDILKLLDNSEKTKWHKSLYLLFLPITAILEYFCFKHYQKIIEKELGHEDFVEFLDKNEFGFKNHSIYKMDVIDREHHVSLKQEVLRNSIRNEVTNAFISEISKITNMKVEELLSVTVQLFENEERVKTYKVSVQYYRLLIVLENKRFIRTWFVFAGLMTGLIYYFL